MSGTVVQRSPAHRRPRPDGGSPAARVPVRAQASAALALMRAAKGCVASTTRSVRSWAQPRGQALRAAEPADAGRHRLRLRPAGAAGERQGDGEAAMPATGVRAPGRSPRRCRPGSVSACSPHPGAFSMTGDALSTVSPAAPWLTIVGHRRGRPRGPEPRRRAPPSTARRLVYGGRRHLALAGAARRRDADLAEPDLGRLSGAPGPARAATCILATGDPFHYGIGAEIARLVPADEMRVFPTPPPSASPAPASAGRWPRRACLTLHGRALPRLVPHLQPGARLLVLTWDGTTPAAVAALLRRARLRRVAPHRAGGHGRPARAPPRARRPSGFDLDGDRPAQHPRHRGRRPTRRRRSSPSARASTMPGSRMTASSPRPTSAP